MHKIVHLAKSPEDNKSARLSFIEFSNLPWEPRRIYWLSNIDGSETRGNHAHKNLSQIFSVVTGKIIVDIFTGSDCQTYHLDSNSGELLITPGHWRVIRDASPDAVLLVLADQIYNEGDYIRDWNQYLEWFGEGKNDI